jgi:UDP-3-O-[3-hydroxymyristoyl] N-acetylglucosamine deacetylase/3-hydroxyacyl-[acyl-carrier-protein] dehydratase
VLHQQTLRQSAAFSGIGLHGGSRVNMTFLPAPPNSGICFRRVDLEGKPEVEAGVQNVSATTRSTSLSRGNVKVQTVEHILAAFAGRGIDNAIVELDASEPPIGDGSSRQYMRMIQAAGVSAQDEPREVFRVQNPILLEQGETMLSIFPHDGFKISCTSAGARGRHTQFYSVEVTPETWERDIAHARTFCFFEEIEALIKNGLIRGGSLENAVVIRDDAVLTTEPLRYPEEFVRHKILDIIGDLSLAGAPIAGHVIAVRPGHTANCEFARQISLEMRKPLEAAQSFSPPPPPPAAQNEAPPPLQDGQALDNARLMKILPHRYPFLMVDKITKIDGTRITGVKNVTINEPYFQGHFPNHPIMPGVLQLEAIAQVAGVMMLRQAENFGKLAYFMSAESVRWRKPVRPGDVLVIEVELTKARGKIGKARGVCSVDGETVSEAEVTFMLFDRQ